MATLQAGALLFATTVALSLWLGVALQAAESTPRTGEATGLALLWAIASVPGAALFAVVLANTTNVSGAVFLFPLLTATIVAYSILQGLPVGIGDLRLYAAADIARAVITLFSVAVATTLTHSVGAALIGVAVAYAVAGLCLIARVPGARDIGLPSRRFAIQRVIKPSLATHPANLLGIGLLRLDIVALSFFASKAQVAYYSLAASFSEGAWLIPAAIGMLSLSDSVRLTTGQARTATGRALTWTITLGVGTSLVIGILGTALVTLFLPDAFQAAVGPLWISLAGASLFSSTYAVSPYLMVSEGRTGFMTVLALAALVLDIALLALLAPSLGAVGASVASSAAYLFSAGLAVLAFRHRPSAPTPAMAAGDGSALAALRDRSMEPPDRQERP